MPVPGTENPGGSQAYGTPHRVTVGVLPFTPGRTLALQACLLAYAAGELLEIAQVFDSVYDAAKSKWSDHLRYSGGSRMDREFMFKVAPQLSPVLEEDIRNHPEEK